MVQPQPHGQPQQQPQPQQMPQQPVGSYLHNLPPAQTTSSAPAEPISAVPSAAAYPPAATPIAPPQNFSPLGNPQATQAYSPMPQQPTTQPMPQTAPAQQSQPAAPQPPRPKNTTQNSLLFSEIRDNMLIMADGSFRAVIACKSINYDLMSARERESVEFSYQNFINSLTHPVQILVRSQKVDIGPYLDRLIEIRRNQDNMLLGVLMDDYIDFIDIIAEDANIMDKSFYVVVPYSTVGDLSNIKDAGKGFFAKMFGGGSSTTVTKIDKITYQKVQEEIRNRVDSVTNGLMQMGIQCTQLNSKQLGELYYSFYNPDTAIREPLSNFRQNTFTYVRRAEGEPPKPEGGI